MREVARKTVISVVEALGPKYLPFVVKEMKAILSKGYQVTSDFLFSHSLFTEKRSVWVKSKRVIHV